MKVEKQNFKDLIKKNLNFSVFINSTNWIPKNIKVKTKKLLFTKRKAYQNLKK